MVKSLHNSLTVKAQPQGVICHTIRNAAPGPPLGGIIQSYGNNQVSSERQLCRPGCRALQFLRKPASQLADSHLNQSLLQQIALPKVARHMWMFVVTIPDGVDKVGCKPQFTSTGRQLLARVLTPW